MARNQPKEFSKNTNRRTRYYERGSDTPPKSPPPKKSSTAYAKCMQKASNAAQKKACQALKP